MIETSGLGKRFDDFEAVRAVDLRVGAGEVVALLGPNGAGKTTTVRMLASILAPTTGRARVAGHDVVTQAHEVRRNIGLLTENHGLYLRMRGDEYLCFFGELQGMPAGDCRRRGRELAERFGIADALPRAINSYSKGMRQKLALVRSLLHDPPVLLLDEPTSAMDPFSAKQVRDCVSDLRREGRAILLCTHNLTEAEMLADRIAIICRGAIVEQGTAAALKERLLGPPVVELRLGRAAREALDDLRGMVEVVDSGDGWVRYRAPQWAATNPAVVARLAERGVPVVTLSLVPRSLEEVYLRAVGASGGQAPAPGAVAVEEALL